MNIDIRFSALEAAKRAMNAPHVDWASSLATLTPPDFMIQLGGSGIEIALDEVECSKDGLLTYKGQQVLLYIKDTRQDRHTLLHDTDKARRFHVADQCPTLEEMRAKNRYDRYVVTNRKDGQFLVDAVDSFNGSIEEIEAPLKVCMNCLKTLDYGEYTSLGYQQRREFWSAFSIKGFFEEFSTHFRNTPKYTDKTSPPSCYSNNWKEVSEKYRERADWKCDCCGVDLSIHKNLLHVHHKNGVKADDLTHNLRALCALCHRNEPSHQRMYVSAANAKIIRQTRLSQGAIGPS